MTMPTIGPKGGAGNSGASAELQTFTPVQHTALKVLGFTLVFLTIGVPVGVLLWKVALWFPGS
jgi:hypothetical protein